MNYKFVRCDPNFRVSLATLNFVFNLFEIKLFFKFIYGQTCLMFNRVQLVKVDSNPIDYIMHSVDCWISRYRLSSPRTGP
jgi:hypothetical protein